MSLPDAPNTLREKYYSVMAGQNDASILPDIETAPSTENRYLDYIARNGGGGGGSAVEVTQIKTNGEKIATITVDDVPTDLYASEITESAMLTLTVAGWDSTTLQQTVTFAHDTAKRNVIDITVSEVGDWAVNNVLPVSETSAGITFKCDTIPASDLTFSVCSMSI